MPDRRPPPPAVDLYGAEHPFVRCDHEVHTCDTRCRSCGCCEHCEVDCPCPAHELPADVACPGEFNGCGCYGAGPPMLPHTPDKVSTDECGRCDHNGLTGGDQPPQRHYDAHAKPVDTGR